MSLARDSRAVGLSRLHATLLSALILAIPSVASASANVQVTIDPPNPQVGQPFRVTYGVRIRNESGAQVGQLEFGALELLSDPSPPQLPMMWGGGFALSIDTNTEYILRAPSPGRYTISGARVYQANGGRVVAQQPPITIVVGGTGAAIDDAGTPEANVTPAAPPDPDAPPPGDLTGADYNPSAFLRAAVDVPNPYLGQQITLRVWLYVASSEANCEVTDEPTLAGFWNEALIPSTRECAARWFTTNVGGHFMSVGLVRKISLFPSQTGQLEIGPTRSNVEMLTGGMFRSMQRVQVRSPSIYVEVREPPTAGRPADYVPGTIGPIQLTAEVDRASGAVGETFAYTVHALSEGSLASTAIAVPSNIDGLRIRAGGAHAQHDITSGHVVSTLDTEILVVPERAGRFDLGTVQITYWDPVRNAYDVARAQMPPITAQGVALARDDSAEHGQDPQSELLALNASPVLRGYGTWFRRGAIPLVAIAVPPVALALFFSIGSMLRSLGRRRRERDDLKRTDPAELVVEARRTLSRDRVLAVSIAGRALDRALATLKREGGMSSLSAEAARFVDEARAAGDAARFAGADADAADLVTKVERAVHAIEGEP